MTGRTCLTGHTCTMVNFSFTPSNSNSITTSWHRDTQHERKATPEGRVLISTAAGGVSHGDVVVSRRSHVGHGPSVPGRQHDLVPDEGVLIHHAIDVSSCDVAANLTERKLN